MERIVGGSRHAVAIPALAHAVCAVPAAGTLYEPNVCVNCWDDVAVLQGSKGSCLQL